MYHGIICSYLYIILYLHLISDRTGQATNDWITLMRSVEPIFVQFTSCDQPVQCSYWPAIKMQLIACLIFMVMICVVRQAPRHKLHTSGDTKKFTVLFTTCLFSSENHLSTSLEHFTIEFSLEFFKNSDAILNFEHIAMQCGLSRVILLF